MLDVKQKKNWAKFLTGFGHPVCGGSDFWKIYSRLLKHNKTNSHTFESGYPEFSIIKYRLSIFNYVEVICFICFMSHFFRNGHSKMKLT